MKINIDKNDLELFVPAISPFFKLTKKEEDILVFLLSRMYKEQRITLTKSDREELTKWNKTTKQVIENYLSKLRKKQVFDSDNNIHTLLQKTIKIEVHYGG